MWRRVENGNTIIPHASEYGMPGLMGIIAAGYSLQQVCRFPDSAFNSMATVSVTDFYVAYKKNESEEHYPQSIAFLHGYGRYVLSFQRSCLVTSTGSVL
ncbi:hypothetical protein O9929_23385 [Vibrio lentus]|nr:hypothetical protein [Vibrio lentus]